MVQGERRAERIFQRFSPAGVPPPTVSTLLHHHHSTTTLGWVYIIELISSCVYSAFLSTANFARRIPTMSSTACLLSPGRRKGSSSSSRCSRAGDGALGEPGAR